MALQSYRALPRKLGYEREICPQFSNTFVFINVPCGNNENDISVTMIAENNPRLNDSRKTQ